MTNELKQNMQNTAPQPKVKQDDSKKVKPLSIIVLIFITLLLLLVGGIVGYLYSQSKMEDEHKDSNVAIQDLEDSSTDTTTTTTTAKTTTTETAKKDPYEGWKTYKNKEIGYSLRYPKDYTLEFMDGSNERCVYIEKDNDIQINIGRDNKDDEPLTKSCFRTGVGAYKIDKQKVDYTINGNKVTFEEWYEHTKWQNDKFGNIYGAEILGEFGNDLGWGFEYWGAPKKKFEAERETVTKILESITW